MPKINKKKMAELGNNKSVFLSNIPNMLTILRIILTFVVMYMIFTNVSISNTVIVFAIAAITDFLDGKLARAFGWHSEFGRRADMIADRFLWVGTALAFVITFGLEGRIGWLVGTQLLLMLTREIISSPFAIIAMFSGNLLPQARYIAKVTTAIQGFALPALLLSIYYPVWFYVSLPLSLAACGTGFISAMYYIKDIEK